MKLKIGDFVSVLDADLSGHVTAIKNKIICIETKTGFEMNFEATELVKIDNHLLKTLAFKDQSIKQILSEKASKGIKKSPKIKSKSKQPPPMEVDLHIHQLVKSTKNMSNHEILTLQLDTAKRRLEFAIEKRIQKVILIHGVGEGVLKLELEYLLGRYNNIKFYPASYQKYGQGATEVYIFQKHSL
tara:strand:- start:677 stop:1234 length:558 start_codon:yes stop_codon:yes gene_type:complete